MDIHGMLLMRHWLAPSVLDNGAIEVTNCKLLYYYFRVRVFTRKRSSVDLCFVRHYNGAIEVFEKREKERQQLVFSGSNFFSPTLST